MSFLFRGKEDGSNGPYAPGTFSISVTIQNNSKKYILVNIAKIHMKISNQVTDTSSEKIIKLAPHHQSTITNLFTKVGSQVTVSMGYYYYAQKSIHLAYVYGTLSPSGAETNNLYKGSEAYEYNQTGSTEPGY